MIPTKTIRVHKKVFDNLAEIANQAGISIGSVITNLATFGCRECGSQYLVDKHNYDRVKRDAGKLYAGCFHCKPEDYTRERLAEVTGKEPPAIVVIPPKVKPNAEPVSIEHVS